MRFSRLAELCDELEPMRRRKDMVGLVAGFLKELDPEEVEPAVLILLGRAFRRWSPKTLEVNWATLRGVILGLTGATPGEFSTAFERTGDLGSATAMIFYLGRARPVALVAEKPLDLLEVKKAFDKIAEASGAKSRERKRRLLEGLLRRASPIEAKHLVKITIGEMRTGFQEGMMELAVSEAFDLDLGDVRRGVMFRGDIAEIAGIAARHGAEAVRSMGPTLFWPIQPALAQNAKNVEDAIRTHGGQSAFEYKLDGARVQIHKRGPNVKIFSRRLSDVTESMPEISELVAREVKAESAILEGEVIAVDRAGRPVPFQYLMQRFRRERDVQPMVRELPLELQLFDALYLDGVSLVDLEHSKRRERLSSIAGSIKLTQRLITSITQKAGRFLNEALGAGHEGLIAKWLGGKYEPGVRGKLWLKIKPVLEPLDLVIVGAEYGYGRRREWLSDCYLAARDAESGRYEIVGKTFKGLTDRELTEMTSRLKGIASKWEGRRVWVKPQIVVEVAYNEIQRSSKYPCGMALRFARIERVREDKGPEDADTLRRVREIYKGQIKKHAPEREVNSTTKIR